jgi:nitric-oxide synthase
LFHAENPEAGSLGQRMRQVRREIESGGTYWHTTAELTFAARVAWRNSARCIGRLYWRSLRVRDRREVSSAAQIAAESFAHLRAATNGGRIRPLITVFAPDAPGQPGPRILNAQLVRYAGYSGGETGPLGDPASFKITRLAQELGWRSRGPWGRFDVLPLIVKPGGAEPAWHEVPADAVLEVPLQHPDYSWFADLGLRWYAVPVISDMRLEAGGICYPAAPFNGWYMCTEIGSRDLGDAARYDQLPAIASRMGLSSNDDRTLWKDRAVTELNLAVMHSFARAGVTITDHHTESVRFLKHLEIEERSGRACPADWTWIVPPAAASTTPVFHRYYANFDASPNFYHHADDSGCHDGSSPIQAGAPGGGADQVPLSGRRRSPAGGHHGRSRSYDRLSGQDRVNEDLGIEECKIVWPFAEAYELDRNAELTLHLDDDPAPCRPVELGEDDPGDVHNLGEHTGLAQAVLSGRCI